MKKVKRSEDLTHTEFVAFVKWVNRFPSKTFCAKSIGISRPTLDAILNTGKGRKSIIETIREEISELKQTA